MDQFFNRDSLLGSRRGRLNSEDINEIILALNQRRESFLMPRSELADRLAERTGEVLKRFESEFQTRW